MVDKRISISAASLIAYLLWSLSLALWGLSVGTDSDEIGLLSIIVCGAAATATIRGYIIDQIESVRTMTAVTRAVDRDDVRPIR